MKNKIFTPLLLGLITLVASCSTSNDVASNHLIQKRKYTKGYHINSTNQLASKTKKVNNQTEINDVFAANQQNDLTKEEVFVSQDPIINKAIESIVSEVPKSNDLNSKREQKVTENAQEEAANDLTVFDVKEFKRFNPFKKIAAKANNNSSSSDGLFILLVILCFLLPWLAVGIYTNWDLVKTLIALILWFLFWIPGVIYALLVIFDVI